MKKIKVVVLSLFFALVSIFVLSSCGNKLPTTKYEKVEFAFNGVEQSIRQQAKKSKAVIGNKENIVLLADTNNPLDIIDKIYTSGDNQGDVIEELEYNEPPMIQFQYLKSVLEKIGSNFEFGNKYYYDIIGSIYADFSTGKKKNESNEYKYDYIFKLGIEINIDDNDLITSDISFDIKLTKENEEINVLWYVGMKLNYDMKNSTPNYTLNLITDEDELHHPSRNCYVVENDYVLVKDNKIEEWRKFCFETNKKLVKDSSHQSFDQYINEDIEYNVNTCKWYKNNSLRKITQMDDIKKVKIANAFFDYGLNTTDINAKSFMDKTGVQNEKIKDCYNSFSKTYGDDIIYSIVTDKEESKKDTDSPTGIKVVFEGTNDSGYNIIFKNVKVKDLFNDNQIWVNSDTTSFVSPKVYYIGKNNNILQEVNYNDIEFYAIYNGTETNMNRNDNIGDLYEIYGKPFEFSIKLVINNFTTTIDKVLYTNANDDTTIDISEIAALGFPEYKTKNELDITKVDNKTYRINNYNYEELNNYKEILLNNGFIYLNSDGSMLGKVSNNELISVRTLYENNNNYIQFKVEETPFENWDVTEISTMLNDKVKLPEPNANKAYYYFNRNINVDKNIYPYVEIYGMTETEISDYINYLSNYGNIVDLGGNNLLRIINDSNNKCYEVHYDLADHNIMRITLYCFERTLKRMEYKINDGNYNSFIIDGSEDNIQYKASNVPLKENDVITLNAINFELDYSEFFASDYFTINIDKTITINESGMYNILYLQNEEDSLYIAFYYEGAIQNHEYELYVGTDLSYQGKQVTGNISKVYTFRMKTDNTGYICDNISLTTGQSVILFDKGTKDVANLSFNGTGISSKQDGIGYVFETCNVNIFISINNPQYAEVSANN